MSRQEMYNRTGGKYEKERYHQDHMTQYKNRRNEQLKHIALELAANKDSINILEVGCGTGICLQYLAQISNQFSLTGVDFSSTMLDEARRKTVDSPNPVTLLERSIWDLPLDQKKYDFIYCNR